MTKWQNQANYHLGLSQVLSNEMSFSTVQFNSALSKLLCSFPVSTLMHFSFSSQYTVFLFESLDTNLMKFMDKS